MFNALKYTEELEKVGFTGEQAKTSLRILIDVMNDNFSTKTDLSGGVQELKHDIETVRISLKSDIDTVRDSLKHDIETVRNSLRSEIDTVRGSLKHEIDTVRDSLRHEIELVRTQIKESELRVTVRLGGMMAVSIGVCATLVKLF